MSLAQCRNILGCCGHVEGPETQHQRWVNSRVPSISTADNMPQQLQCIVLHTQDSMRLLQKSIEMKAKAATDRQNVVSVRYEECSTYQSSLITVEPSEPRDWNRPSCQPHHTWLQTAESDFTSLIVSCFSKIQIVFTFLVLADLGSPRKRAVKRVCVYRLCVCAQHCPGNCLSLGTEPTCLERSRRNGNIHQQTSSTTMTMIAVTN